MELDVVKKVFDSAYSFDKKDCQQTELNYLNQFFPFGFKEIDKITENVKCTPKSCFFLGKDKERIDIIENLATILKKHSCVISFYVVRDRTSLKNSEYYIDKNLSYEENIENALHSEILIEINREGQSGLTLRALEAIFFNKKLITNNQDIVQYDFYSPEQIFILGKDSFDDIGKFLDTEFTPVRKDILYQYSPDAMLETIIRNLSLLKNP
ncbi:lipopolysaccharide biosynthesis protein [Brenneria roseae]|uniref:lipopolysaccharide biosynthesis protein n=1 Tax=Brenneria roseae TaxID=1509241 RepID=UPI00109DDE55|nr:lipopolysaccharide biosynthesis protein [Brenneria roseae]